MSQLDIKDNSQDKPEECDSCGYGTTELKPYRIFQLGAFHTKSHKWLCKLCDSTLAGIAYEYPDQYQGQTAILRSISYVGNIILDRLKEKSDQ